MAVEPAVGALLAYHLAFASTWQPWQFAAWAMIILVGFELLSVIVSNWANIFGTFTEIPVRGKHLDELATKDWTFIWINRCISVAFVYHVLHYSWVWGHDGSSHVSWALDEVTFLNTVGSWLAFHVIYDFIYCLFHRALHNPKVYRLVHKHHHTQTAPSRGNKDAINVHPFEFISGEYLHLFCIFCVPCHIYAVVVFIVAGGFLASLNHTRFDVATPFGIWDVKYHDQHHAVPTTNYGQYTMLWDHVFGSFQASPQQAKEGQRKMLWDHVFRSHQADSQETKKA